MKTKLKPPLSVGRLIFSHVILWPILHIIVGLISGGVMLLLSIPAQVIDLCRSLNIRAKYKEARYEEMLDAIREGKK